VFGKRAGEFAAKCAQAMTAAGRIDESDVERVAADSLRPFEERGGKQENPFTLQGELQGAMQKLVGIVRTEEDLKAALATIAELRARSANVKCGGNIQYNPGWHLALDLKNMLDISEAVTRAALERTESRGAHTREDFPNTEKEWGKVNVIVRQGADGIEVAQVSLAPMPGDLKKLVEGE
jgi:succinate dehydrogenase flavoprotein subunit